MEYGLIGKKLGHSFSKQIHETLAPYTYHLCELASEDDVAAFLKMKHFKAINITIPYKQTVLPFCDVLDESAKAIGAVNTIINQNGKLTGYNTDFAGCQYALRSAGISLAGKTVLILGSGGTQKTFVAVAKAAGAANILCASRTQSDDTLSYDALAQHPEVQVLLNATPVGMYPNNGECLVDLGNFPRMEAVFDAVYNPFETALLQQARSRELKFANGLVMLVAQAKYAAELFLHGTQPIDDAEISRVARQIRSQRANLTLIGMPSCGKSTLGVTLAAMLGKQFVDFDTEIVRRAGKEIAAIFSQDGEAAFRALESAVCAEFSKQNGLVMAPGGGIVLHRQNIDALQQNGVVIYLNRPLDMLELGGGRPLSQSAEALAQMYSVRAPLYSAAADKMVDNAGSAERAAQEIKEAFDEISGIERT